MRRAGIYAIRNRLSGKAYYGSALNISKRWAVHLRLLRDGKHHAIPLQRAWSKYGEDAFAFDVLELVEERERLLSREQFWIDAGRAAAGVYNMAKVAGSRLGMKTSAATKAKISASAKGRVIADSARALMRSAALSRPPELIAKIAASHTGWKHRPETRAAIAAKIAGGTRSTETRAKIGAASRGRRHSPETTAKRLATLYANRAAKAAEQQ